VINDQLLSQIGLLLKEAVPPLIRVTDSPSSTAESPHWAPGDKLPATVLTTLPNGRFQVQVDNQILELNLPKNTQPCDQLELVYIGNSPRLTFTLASAPALLTAAPMPAGLPAAAELSETAHLLGQLSQQGSKVAQGVAAQAPVVSAPPSDAGQLAVALARTLAGSGLFYESHQAQWVQGERPLAALLQEPQAQQAQGQQVQGQQVQEHLLPMLPGPGASLPVMQPTAGLSLHGPQVQPGQAALPQAQATIPAGEPVGHQPAAAVPTVPYAMPAGLDPANVALLQQQLQLLDSGTIQWSGPVWPGQQMEWEISGLPAGQGEEGQQWQTRLNLTLPGLGKMSAWLLLGKQGLQVRLQADAESTRQLLVASGTTLDRALQTAGLILTHYKVESHGQT
jgi:hypothetical protein